MVRLIREFIASDIGAEFVAIEEMWVPDFSARDADVQELCGNTEEVGIWYQSGHAFFHEGEDDNED